MNLAVEQTPDLDAALIDAKQRRAAARTKLAALDARLVAARESTAAAQAAFEARAEEKAAFVARRARSIEAWWADDHRGAPQPSLPIPRPRPDCKPRRPPPPRVA